MRPTAARKMAAARRRGLRVRSCSARSGPGDGRRRSRPSSRRCGAPCAARESRRASGRSSPSTSFSGDTPLTPARGRSSRLRGAIVRARSRRSATSLVGNEPNLQPVLAAAVRAGRRGRRRAAYVALLADDLRRAQGRRPGVERHRRHARRRAAATSRRRPDPRTRRRVHPRPRRRVPRERSRPAVMDMFSIHPYAESSHIPPTFAAPALDVDRARRLRQARRPARTAFDGDGSAGIELPIVYGEYGVETTVPPAKARIHRRGAARRRSRVDRADAGALLPQAIELAACQPNVRMLFFFHVIDETQLDGLQTGVYYADGSPKPSLPVAAAAKRAGNRGAVRATGERPVHRLHVLPRRPRVASAAGRGARGGEGRLRRGGRGLRAPVRCAARVLDDRRAAGQRLLPLEDHRSATRTSASSARRSTRRRSRAGSRRRTRTSRRRRPRSTRAPGAPRKIMPKGSPYLVVYPFVKVRPWYALPEADRQRAMDEHMRIGRDEFPTIHNHTTYSFGIDDQEFMTAFECDEPADFMHLMLTLRDIGGVSLHRARHADLRRAAHGDPRGARAARRRELASRGPPLASSPGRARARGRASLCRP